MTAKERDDLLGPAVLLALAAAVWILWTTRPVSAYLAAAFALAWIFHGWKIWSARPANEKKSIGKLGAKFSEELRDTSLAIAAGLALVVVAQVILTLGSRWVEEGTVQTWEQRLSLLRIRLDTVLSFRYLLLLFVVLSLLPLVFPGLRLVPWVQDRLRLLSRIATALTAATSFTFFAAADVGVHETEWVAHYKDAIKPELGDTMRARRQLVAAAMVQKQAAGLSPLSRTNLANFLKDVRGSNQFIRQFQLDSQARELVGSAPVRMEASKDDTEESIFEGLSADARVWMHTGDSMGYSPSLKDIRNQNAPFRERLQRTLDQINSATATLLSSSISEILGNVPDILKSWIDALVGAWTDSLGNVNPKEVQDQASAESFVERRASSAATAAREPGRESGIDPRWALEIRPVKLPDPSVVPDRFPRFPPDGGGPSKDRTGKGRTGIDDPLLPGRIIEPAGAHGK